MNVALSWETWVARGRRTGMVRPTLPSTVASPRACAIILVEGWKPVSLNAAGFTKRVNIMGESQRLYVKFGKGLFKMLQLTEAFQM